MLYAGFTKLPQVNTIAINKNSTAEACEQTCRIFHYILFIHITKLAKLPTDKLRLWFSSILYKG